MPVSPTTNWSTVRARPKARFKNETAEAIADITSTGETLRANHLKILSDGPILKSQATLYRSRTADWSGATESAWRDLEASISN